VPGPDAPQQQAIPSLMRELAGRPVILLGETHSSAEHHRWQLHTIAALHSRQPNMALGFEMFPRRVQPTLDQWVAGTLTEAQFLERSEWGKVWGFDPELYLPIFHFARMHRIPMVALNVERSLVAAVGDNGWASIPASQREGVTDPAPPAKKYRDALFASYLEHLPEDSPLRKQPTAEVRNADFERFVQAMQVWDRAMAQAIAQRRAGSDPPMVVAIMGSGHLRDGYGVPHQLRDLGVHDAAALLPWDIDEDCAKLKPAFADVVFGVDPPAAAPTERPRLGVRLEQAGDAVTIREVVNNSVAQSAGLRSGDEITSIAGQPAKSVDDVVQAVQRMAPGTWLPLTVRRDKESLELVARFPPKQ
jgi:uncharacterized iron-regulated protein